MERYLWNRGLMFALTSPFSHLGSGLGCGERWPFFFLFHSDNILESVAVRWTTTETWFRLHSAPTKGRSTTLPPVEPQRTLWQRSKAASMTWRGWSEDWGSFFNVMKSPLLQIVKMKTLEKAMCVASLISKLRLILLYKDHCGITWVLSAISFLSGKRGEKNRKRLSNMGF